MRRHQLVRALALAVVSIIVVAPRSAAYNILSLDMGGYWNDLQAQYVTASEGYGTPGLEGERWYTRVTPEQFQDVNLLDYDVFLVQSGFTDDWVQQEAIAALEALSARRADIAQFVRSGGGLVSFAQPLPDGEVHGWDWAPVSIATAGVYHENAVLVADPDHPVMTGLDSAALSGWQSSWHGWFETYDPRLSAIAWTGDYGDGDPRTRRALTLAGAHNAGGCGRMLFSMQDADYHAYQQSPDNSRAGRFVANSLDWANATCDPVPEPTSVALLGTALGGWIIRRRIRRGRRAASSIV